MGCLICNLEIFLDNSAEIVPVCGVRGCGGGKGVLVGDECVLDAKRSCGVSCGIHGVGDKEIEMMIFEQSAGVAVGVQEGYRDGFGEPEGFCEAEEAVVSSKRDLAADFVNGESLFLNEVVNFAVGGKRAGVPVLCKICGKFCGA